MRKLLAMWGLINLLGWWVLSRYGDKLHRSCRRRSCRRYPLKVGWVYSRPSREMSITYAGQVNFRIWSHQLHLCTIVSTLITSFGISESISGSDHTKVLQNFIFDAHDLLTGILSKFYLFNKLHSRQIRLKFCAGSRISRYCSLIIENGVCHQNRIWVKQFGAKVATCRMFQSFKRI